MSLYRRLTGSRQDMGEAVFQGALGNAQPLKERIRTQIAPQVSPHHLPVRILAAPAVPRTLSGKKMELPVRRMLQGEPASAVMNRDAVEPQGIVEWLEGLAAQSPAADPVSI